MTLEVHILVEIVTTKCRDLWSLTLVYSRHVLLKCLHQATKVSGHVAYRLSHSILELLWKWLIIIIYFF